MVPEFREDFNRRYTPELYAEFLKRLSDAAGAPAGFRCSETPIFLPTPLLEKMARYGRELYEQLANNFEYRAASESAIPAQFRVPNEAQHPLFVQADFGLVSTPDGAIEPKLVEIQGFPSLYAFQIALADQYREVYGLDNRLSSLLSGLSDGSYKRLLARTILNGHAPQEVVLLEIDPYNQKTLADFLLTEKMIGLRIASLTEVTRQGNRLYLDGIPIKRIYNRVIVDEVLRKGIQAQFAFTDDLRVEWAGHPNWFFRLSKFSLPWFKHPCVPETWFLHQLPELPDLEDYVLKPLYSFAGLGVNISPTKGDIDAIPEAERANYILQRKMHFIPTVETPSGPTKAEIRIMYIHDGTSLVPVTTVLRTGRGKMMGVDFNKNLDWVGASAGFYLPE